MGIHKMGLIRLRKIYEDDNILIVDEVRLFEGSSFKVKEVDGFTVLESSKDGIKHRGGIGRIWESKNSH